MVQYSSNGLDAAFAALSDATRRGVLAQLARADASISDLAQTFHMTLTGMRKHVIVLERAELVMTEKVGRVRTCRLGPRRLTDEAAWLDWYRQLWDARFDELDRIVQGLGVKEEKTSGRYERGQAHVSGEQRKDGADLRPRTRDHPHDQRPGADRVRGVDQP